MTRKKFLLGVLCWLLFMPVNLPSLFSQESETVVSWDFDDSNSQSQWISANLIAIKNDENLLLGKPTSYDPFWITPHFNLKPNSGQYIEIRMRSTGNGQGQIFYASSDEGQYNGFSESCSVSFPIRHDGEFHVYQIIPPWLSEPQIIKLRLDVGAPTSEDIEKGASVAIDYVKIIDPHFELVESSCIPDWKEDTLDQIRTDSANSKKTWKSPIIKLDPKDAGSNLFIEWEYDMEKQSEDPFELAQLICPTATTSGLFKAQIPLFNCGEEKTESGKAIHYKNVDLSAYDGWGTSIFGWEITLPSHIELKRLAITPNPINQGMLERQEGRQSSLVRMKDSPAIVSYEAIVRNCGGTSLNRFTISLDNIPELNLSEASLTKISTDPLLGFNPKGDRSTALTLVSDLKEESHWDSIAENNQVVFDPNLQLLPNEAFKVVAKFMVSKAGEYQAPISVKGSSHSTDGNSADVVIEIPTSLHVLPAISLPENPEYVPEPQPLQTDFEIGAFYFPGWSKAVNWKKIDEAAPIRKPLLGYYDEGNPEVVDWQIKWAVENGISFFLVDWYWYHGKISLDHWIQAFQKAQYRSYLKWAVMWANHTGYGTHSTEDWKNVTHYWIDNYFKTPEYYTIDGKPVVIIWQPEILDRDMIDEAKQKGINLKPGEGWKRAFDISRQICVEEGLPGIYFIAMKWPEHAVEPSAIQKLAEGTFDATSIYHFMYPGNKVENPLLYSFEQVVDASKPYWEKRNDAGILPFLPNLSTGWDSRPWHGFKQTVVYGRTVSGFKRLLESYKSFADETGVKRVVLGPLNEWGEGSYIEPNQEFGFGMYEAIRETFCEKPANGFPNNYAPYEAGLGPYDLLNE